MGWTDWIKGRRVPTFHLGADDIAVFVVGPSGSGKSSFVEQVTKSGLIKVGTNLQPHTDDVQAIRCELTDEAKKALGVVNQKNIVFVDTPSFHTGVNDQTAEGKMKNWLKKSKSKSTLVGTIYMRRIATNPSSTESIQQHLNTFALAFPPDFAHLPQRLRGILSHYEGIIADADISTRKSVFESQLNGLKASLARLSWVPSLHPDLLRGSDPEAAWEVVLALLKD